MTNKLDFNGWPGFNITEPSLNFWRVDRLDSSVKNSGDHSGNNDLIEFKMTN